MTRAGLDTGSRIYGLSTGPYRQHSRPVLSQRPACDGLAAVFLTGWLMRVLPRRRVYVVDNWGIEPQLDGCKPTVLPLSLVAHKNVETVHQDLFFDLTTH